MSRTNLLTDSTVVGNVGPREKASGRDEQDTTATPCATNYFMGGCSGCWIWFGCCHRSFRQGSGHGLHRSCGDSYRGTLSRVCLSFETAAVYDPDFLAHSQLKALEGFPDHPSLPLLREVIKEFRDDELEHLDTAVVHNSQRAPAHALLSTVIGGGCKIAIELCKRF